MKSFLRVLHLEDDPNDVELVRATLARVGFDCDLVCVEKRRDYTVALEQENFDLILADYSLPSLGGMDALAIAKERRPHIPFIIVSDSLREELAIESLKAGATDYVLKDRPSRLAAVVMRALNEAEERAQRKRAEEALRRSEEKYRNLFESSKDGIFISDDEGRVVDANQAYIEMLGYSREEIRGVSSSQITPARWHRTDRDILMNQVLARGYSDDYEKEYVRKNGTVFPISTRVWLTNDDQGNSGGMWGIVRDITDRKRMEARLRSLSLQDELTKLYNRRGFFAIGEQQRKSARRNGKVMSLLFADMDDMKIINDTLGHEKGDQALQETADILSSTFRESDTIARIGGDEFVVLSLQDSEEDSRVLTRRLLKNLDDANSRRGKPYSLSLSLGVASYGPDDPCSLDELLVRADREMYENKNRKGKT